MVLLEKTPKKIIAVILSLLLLLGTVPAGVFSVFAEQLNNFSIVIEGYNESATVTLTQSDDTGISKTVTAESGRAVFDDFYDDEKTYDLKVSDLIGYKDFTESAISAEGNSFTVSGLEEIAKILISGTVVNENGDAASDVNISYSAYGGRIDELTQTDSNGEYSFEAYSGIEYVVNIDAGERYDTRSVTIEKTTDSNLGKEVLTVKEFTITTAVGSNGSVDNGLVTVYYGEDAANITVTADMNYRIDELAIDGEIVDEATGAQFFDVASKITNVKENHTVSVTFYRPTYEITINYNSNGEVRDNSDNPVSSGGSVILEEGAEAGFTAVPAENYHIGSISIDDADIDEKWSNDYGNYSKTFKDNKKHTVTIIFTINTFDVTVNAGENGNAAASSTVAAWNEDSTITIIPDDGYDIDTFAISNDSSVDVSYLTETDSGYTYAICGITENVNVNVTFRKIDIVSVSDQLSNEYYTVAFSKEPVVTESDYIVANGETITITPNEPYKRIRFANSIIAPGYTEFTASKSKSINYICLSDNEHLGGWNTSINVDINFVVDSTAPEIMNIIKRPSDEYYNSSYNVSMTVSDDLSGVDKVLYSTENDISTAAEAEYDLKTDTASFTTTDKEFNGVYYIWAIDKVGNTSAASSIDIKIDKTLPTIDNFEFSSNSLNPCAFGTFSNDDIEVIITAGDAYSGVKEITFNGETKAADNGIAAFTLNSDDFVSPKAVSAYATDNAGNRSDVVVPGGLNSNVKSNIVTISSVEAAIDITKSSQQPQYDNGTEVWYDGDNEFTVNINDTFGLKSVVITMNDKVVKNEILDQKAEAVTAKTYTINTSENALDGKNEIKVRVVNVSGNSSESSDEVYIDTTKPDVTGFEFASKGTSLLEKALNFLTFGNFFNEIIEIKVFAKDDNASSGLKEITLYGDEEAIDTQPVVDGAATFVIPAEDITDETMHFNKTISAKAKDNVDNQTADFVYPTTTNSDTFADSGLMIETIEPTIDVRLPEAAKNKNSKTADENDWYAEDIDFNISIHDADSGIRNVFVDINGISINTDKDGQSIAEDFYKNDSKITELSFRVNTDQAEINEDGSYIITISVTDNAGNVSETYTNTIYKDVDDPVITDFKFEAAGYRNDEAVSSASTNETTVEVTDYGFYFTEDTKVTVTSHDTVPTAGIKSITYYTVDKDGGKSKENTVQVDENNQISFTVPADFKGQIYAKATDNVGNTTEDFVNPNSAIVESPEQHKKTSSITYTLKNTDYKDADGNNLYAENTTVDFEIVDSYSGIRQIDWEIVSPYDDKKQAGTVRVANDKTLVSAAKEGYSDDCLGEWKKTTEDNLVTALKNTITVSNNSNNIQIKITLTDRAGNVTEDVVQTLSIDKTAPKIVVQMNENDDNTYSGFFRTERTVDVYVYERNFKSEYFNFAVSRKDDNDAKSNIKIKPSFKKVGKTVIDGAECYIYKMSYSFTADGDYTFKVNAKDSAKNSTSDKNVKYSSNKTDVYANQNDADRAIDNSFTIDKTAPSVSVTYDNNNAENGKYFNNFRTATITVTEHNFTSENNRIIYTRASVKDGKTIETPSVSSWSRKGNVYTATIRYSADGDYTFGIDVTDKAGNLIKDTDVSYPNGREVSKNFTIDTTIDKPAIGGVENGKSYKEDVIPTINIDDVNYASSTVQLLRTQKDDINRDVTDQYITNKPSNRVTVSEDTFEKIKENDGIYTLNVSVTDMAGNTASDSVTFTVNRFGSVYEYSRALVDLKDAYVQNVAGDIVITEYNPDRLVKGSLKIEVTCDGVPVSDVKCEVNPVINNAVTIGESGWYQYDYVFDNSNFGADGIYTITVASEDEVGNKPESTNDSDILFRVDSTPPDVVSIDGLEKARVNAVEQKVNYSIYDAIGLQSIVVHINNIAQEPITDFEDVSNYTGSLVVNEGYQNEVRIVITDLAGNVTDTSSTEFKPEFDFNDTITVSTNIFVLWYSNKPLFWGSICALIAAAGFILFLIVKRRRKDNDEEQTAQ